MRRYRFAAQHDRRDAAQIDHVHRLRDETHIAGERAKVEVPVDAGDARCQAANQVCHRILGSDSGEMIQQHDASARAADAQHFARHADRIGDDVHQVSGIDRVEVAVGKRQPRGVHPAQRHMREAMLLQSRLRTGDHRRGKIDGHHSTVARIRSQAKSCADPHLEHAFAGLRAETGHRPSAPRLQHPAIDDVVNRGETLVDSFDGRAQCLRRWRDRTGQVGKTRLRYAIVTTTARRRRQKGATITGRPGLAVTQQTLEQ